QGPTRPAGGWDYRLIGRITSIDEINSSTGEGSRYYQFTFEMIQRGSTIIVWAGAYKVKKVGRDDVTHR
ncbi:MAG: penicillin-binding protein activator LpoB, partial [Candidatus Brocadiia bacterium]